MPTRSLSLVLVVLAGTIVSTQLRYPAMGRQIRVEMHLVPAVSTGPLDPAWSPDGGWLAFSMRGDIWKLPSRGGEAIALTEGPGYHFEPAWSPDGRRLALTVDLGGNVDLALVGVDGGPIERLTVDPHVDMEPVWSPDGTSLFFVTGRKGNLDIYRLDPATKSAAPVVEGDNDQFQPAISPDGRRLLYIDQVAGRLGTGGIWVKDLASGTTALVRYEETNYRAKPAWTPDGLSVVYVSDESGSHDVAIVPAAGGNPVRLTWDGMDEYAPAVSPDGKSVVYVSNRPGPTMLMTVPIDGGTGEPVEIKARKPRRPAGTLRLRVTDADGRPTPARIHLRASDGRAYSPDGGFQRVVSVSELHYFDMPGEIEVEVPAGRTEVEAMKGFEYQPVARTVDVTAGSRTDVILPLARLVDAPGRGWFSGDTHLHDWHSGRFGLAGRHLANQVQAEDVHVANILVHMDDTRVMGRWSDVIGRPSDLSTREHIIYHSEEFRGSLGHVGLLGLRRLVLPVLGSTPMTAYASDVVSAPQLEEARRQGGIGGFLHPYNYAVPDPKTAAATSIPIEAALGAGDFYDVVCIWSDEPGSAQMYYRLLNSGFRIAATGGSDTPSNVWRAPPPGTGRTFARLDGPLTFDAWIAAVKARRTFGTNGPLLFLEVNGKRPGEEITAGDSTSDRFVARVEVVSIAPVERVEIIVNGEVAHSEVIRSFKGSHTFETAVTLRGSGWIAARAVGPPSRYVADSYAYAQTSPIDIVRNGVRYTAAKDAQFLLDSVDALWARVEARNRWRSQAERQKFLASVEQARAVYRRIVQDAPTLNRQ